MLETDRVLKRMAVMESSREKTQVWTVEMKDEIYQISVVCTDDDEIHVAAQMSISCLKQV